jgi:RNA polymerase sigma factor (sigma-70 family)
MATDTHRAIEAAWKLEAPELIAGLTRIVRDIALAEDLAHDALVAALEQWPRDGIPRNPAAWLMAAAKHRAIDQLRRRTRLERKHEELAHEGDIHRSNARNPETALDDDVNDDLLRLIFIACHPVLSLEAQVALTLRLLGGLTTDEIARAFFVPEPTIAQRIVRAKRTLAKNRVPFEVPRGVARAARLSSVLSVLYLIFNEGYTATAGDEWVRPSLCEDALRLGRILAELAPWEPEVHGLVGLMEIQASRLRARVDPSGQPILLLYQNRALWDQLLIRRGLNAIHRAERLGRAHGPYMLQALIAACHARASEADQTDWNRIVSLYDALVTVSPSPVVSLNRAVAVGMASGPQAGLDAVEQLRDQPMLRHYHLLASVRGDLLVKVGRLDEARREFERAASLTRNARERALLLGRSKECVASGGPSHSANVKRL